MGQIESVRVATRLPVLALVTSTATVFAVGSAVISTIFNAIIWSTSRAIAALPSASADSDDSNQRVGWVSHAISEEDLRPGDHIYCHRTGYSHHGIYIGEEDCEVIHFAGDGRGFVRWDPIVLPGVGINAEPPEVLDVPKIENPKASAKIRKCTLQEFLNRSQLRLVAYGESKFSKIYKYAPAGHIVKSDELEVVIRRAKYYLDNPQKWEDYNLLLNNCESFACYCKTEITHLNAQGIGFGVVE